MKRSYSKWPSVALITGIYVLAGVLGALLFVYMMNGQWAIGNEHSAIISLFCADVLATVVVWAFGLLYENVSVYDP